MQRIAIFLVVSFILPLKARSTPIKLDALKVLFEKQISKLPKQISLSMLVETAGDRKVIYSHKKNTALVPASSMKLLTSSAALEIMGPAHTLKTRVLLEGTRKGDTLDGHLVLVGNGDPYLVSERLWLLARAIARTGIKKITGGIKVNNEYFPENDTLLNLAGKGEPYAAKLAATSFNFNSLELHASVGNKKEKVIVHLGPVEHGYGKIINDVRLVPGKTKSVRVTSKGRKKGIETFRLSGNLGREASPLVLYYPVEDTSAYISHVLAAMLKKESIEIKIPYAGNTNFDSGKELTKIESPPLTTLLRLMNTYSNNFMAEQFFYIMGAIKHGAPATKEKSKQVLDESLKKIPECRKDTIFADNGSGFSWKSRISAACLVGSLQKSYRKFRGFADLIGSMPIGANTGTLKKRFHGFDSSWFHPTKVRAKTGTLWSQGAVTSIVGFTSSYSGEPLVFSLLLNHKESGSKPILPMRNWEEKIISLLQKVTL